jgi:MFS family permease
LNTPSNHRQLSIPIALTQTFAAFKYPNFRIWFVGQLLSLVGTWMQSTAQGYLIYELTKSPAFLGYVAFVGGIPTWMFMLYAGVIGDRIPRKTMLIITQSIMMVLAFAISILVFTNNIRPWHILIMAFLLGIANAFDAPPRQAFIADLVDRKDLTNAIALNATMFNAALVVGPAIGGLLYAWFGPGWCFAINGASFICVLVALVFITRVPFTPRTVKTSALSDLKEGLVYVRSNKLIQVLIINIGMMSIFGTSLLTLLPAWSVQILGGDVRTNGALLSARGLGALAGSLAVAALSQRNIRGWLWTVGVWLMPLTLLIFTFLRWLPLALVVAMFYGLAFLLTANCSNAIIQTHTPDALRGRVMSVYLLVFFGCMPVGSLISGNVAEWIGEPATVFISAAIMLVVAFIWLWRAPEMRKVE